MMPDAMPGAMPDRCSEQSTYLRTDVLTNVLPPKRLGSPLSDALTRKGDDSGYFLSGEFWADRYREFVVGDFTTRETIRARQAKAALLMQQEFTEEEEAS